MREMKYKFFYGTCWTNEINEMFLSNTFFYRTSTFRYVKYNYYNQNRMGLPKKDID